ncbi:FHA domain-containing protein DDL [Ananas comosus]|uniref:FHA domain-containing protein DDL n=1 Tax=Ananas comosus TaxID=4615 RepID=A0A199UQY4_ANACO|nr:FHA domain-containing protein DDL [Ananas comosus]
MAPAVERRERSRRSPPPARSNSLERERRSPRRRSSPRRERSPNHRRDRSPVRTSSSHRVRSPPVKEKLPERARSPKHHRPRSPVGNGASSRSPSPRTKRLKRAQSEREAEHPSREEREKGKNRERGESRDGSRDRREDREKNDGGGLGRLSRRDRSISPEEHGRKARHGSRSPPRTSKAGERDEASRSRDTVANRVGDNDSLTKMNAAAEALEEKDKHKPSFELSGKLAEETNRVRGITLLFTEPPEARKPEIRWRLYVFKGGEVLNEPLYVHRQSCYLFGRERRIADIPTDHPSCSKQHAVLQYRLVEKEQPDGLMSKQVRPYLMDLDSTNGTFINDNRIEPRRYYELFEKDTVKFGNSSREYVLLHENSAG